MRLLIVEDDRTLNDGIALSLKAEETLQAYTIAEAEKLFTEDVDLVILDIHLPDGNGLALCRKLRAESQVPVIILTANDLEVDIVTGLESGADDYITKPFSLMVLRHGFMQFFAGRLLDRQSLCRDVFLLTLNIWSMK